MRGHHLDNELHQPVHVEHSRRFLEIAPGASEAEFSGHCFLSECVWNDVIPVDYNESQVSVAVRTSPNLILNEFKELPATQMYSRHTRFYLGYYFARVQPGHTTQKPGNP